MHTSYFQYISNFSRRHLNLLGFVFALLLWALLTLLHLFLGPNELTALHMASDFLVIQAGTWLLSTWLARILQRHEDEVQHRIAQLDALHAAALAVTSELQQSAVQLAVLQERERFGRDLHDGVIQSLYGIGLLLEDSQQRIEHEPSLVYERLTQILGNMNSVIMDIRSYILDLQPQSVRRQGVGERLKDLVAEVCEGAFRTTLEIADMDPRLLSSAQSMELLRVAQEALSNVKKHALASEVVVHLYMTDATVHLTVEDNGVGFVPEDVVFAGGLHNMKERAKLLEGDLRIESEEGQGTRVHLCFVP